MPTEECGLGTVRVTTSAGVIGTGVGRAAAAAAAAAAPAFSTRSAIDNKAVVEGEADDAVFLRLEGREPERAGVRRGATAPVFFL